MPPPPTIERYFVCVGAQKAGTTWLARMLGQHPQIFVTPVKEIHYFDHLQGLTQHLGDRKRRSRLRKYLQKLAFQWNRHDELRRQWSWWRHYRAGPLDDAWYASLFAERDGRTFAGEATPEYALIGEAGFRHLARLAPDARVLYILRDPADRTWSHVLHLCRARRLDAARLTPEALLAIAREPRVETLSDYASTLDALDGVFSPSQLLVLFYEGIHADRMAALARICRFIGAEYDPSWFAAPERKANRSQDAPAPAEVRSALRARHRATVDAVAERLAVPTSWRT